MNQTKTKKSKILIVDDHEIVREGLKSLIHTHKEFEVAADVATVEEALEIIGKEHFDLALVDITLKGMSGLELIKRLKKSHPSLPTLVISMHSEMVNAERCLRAGARGYIMKHEATQNIAQAMRRVLSGEIVVSERLNIKMLRDMVSGKAEIAGPLDALTQREHEIFLLIAQGYTKHKIGQMLNLSPKTVDSHRANVINKLKLKDVNDLNRYSAVWLSNQSGQSF